jgi:hypothetical protein
MSLQMNDPSPAIREYCTLHGFSKRVCDGGLEYLMHDWQRTVGDVVGGFTGLFDEYLNDMDGRRIIDELLPLADDTERRMVASSLPALDDGFLNATLPTSSCIWGEDVAEKHNYIPGRDWWYYRVPSNLGRVEDPDAWPKVHPLES